MDTKNSQMPSTTMVNVLLHWCCVMQIKLRFDIGVLVAWKNLYNRKTTNLWERDALGETP